MTRLNPDLCAGCGNQFPDGQLCDTCLPGDRILELAALLIEARCSPAFVVRGWTKQMRRLAGQIEKERHARLRRSHGLDRR